MARPAGGYKAADGKRIPGVTTILSRFKESGGLIHWAWQQGMDGVDYRETRDSAADAGTLAHTMVELYLTGGKPSTAITSAVEPEVAEKAEMAFSGFLEWANQTRLQVIEPEVSLISEKYRFGGTLDCAVLSINGKRSLGDWKTSNGLYPEYLIQVGGGYALLWEENRPDELIDGGFHIFRFSKEHGDFHHHYFPELDTAKRAFLLMRELYELDKELKARAK